MTLTARDKKIAMILVPVLVVVGFWFLVIAPKRQESARLGEQLAKAEQTRDDAEAKATQLEAAKSTYAKDYTTVVRLGKAIPSALDMPSLLVQLDKAAKGTNIDFDSVKAGERSEAAAPAPASGASGTSAGQGTPATQKAKSAQTTSDNANQAAGADANSSGSGSSSPTTASVLDSVPLDFTFTGSYSDLADFFHDMKRFVKVANESIKVQGRLMTIDTVDFDSSTFPKLQAQVSATVYLSPKGEGTAAGGTPSGPQPATPAGATEASPSEAPAAPASNSSNPTETQ